MNPGEYSRWSKLDRPWFIEIQRIRIAEILTTITMSVVLLTNSGGIVGRRIRGIGAQSPFLITIANREYTIRLVSSTSRCSFRIPLSVFCFLFSFFSLLMFLFWVFHSSFPLPSFFFDYFIQYSRFIR